MKIAISPCPNDTFLFYPWIAGLVGQEIPVEPTFADIQQLNLWALSEQFPLIKISLGCYPQVADAYEVLPVGAALGFQCGPKIVSKIPFHPSEISQKTIAIPGRDTTAHLLFNYLFPSPYKKIFCLYHEIFDLIDQRACDCGLIIHESRFTFADKGLCEIADLGELWHQETKAPLPLGILALVRTTPQATKERLVEILRESLALSQSNPEQAMPFVLHHSQEKDRGIVMRHIQTYVTEETAALSQQGQKAIDLLLSKQLL